MSSLDQIPLKKIFLRSLIVSVGLSAALGILVILLGDFGEFESKVLLTTLTLSAASLFGLCDGAAVEMRGKHTIPIAGFVLAFVSAVVVIVGIWIEAEGEQFWKTAATLAIFAFTFSHLSLLQLARLTERYAWSMAAAYPIVFSVAGMLTGMLWKEWTGDWLFRMLGVLAILDAAITILIPVFHRLGQEEFQHETAPSLKEIGEEIARLESRLRELKEMKRSAESGS